MLSDGQYACFGIKPDDMRIFYLSACKSHTAAEKTPEWLLSAYPRLGSFEGIFKIDPLADF